jgi:hypothetical protein
MPKLPVPLPLRDGKEDGGILDRIKVVRARGNDQQIALTALPRRVPCDQPHAPPQHMHGGLAGVLVFGQLLPAAEGDHGLAHDVVVSAERRAGGPTGRSAASGLKLLACEGVEGELLQRDRPLSGHDVPRGCTAPYRADGGEGTQREVEDQQWIQAQRSTNGPEGDRQELRARV